RTPMFVQLNCAIVDPDATNREELAGFLSRYGVHVTAQLGGADQLASLVGKPDVPQLIIINLDPGAHEKLQRVAPLPRQYPNLSFFLMSELLDPNLLMEAMH